jgi:hypothetical protein
MAAAYGAFVGLTNTVRVTSTDAPLHRWRPQLAASQCAMPQESSVIRLSLSCSRFIGATSWISKYMAGATATNPKMIAATLQGMRGWPFNGPNGNAAAVAAHAKAFEDAVGYPGLVASKAGFAAVNEALAPMFGSANPVNEWPSLRLP